MSEAMAPNPPWIVDSPSPPYNLITTLSLSTKEACHPNQIKDN